MLEHFALYLLAVLSINLIPGPDMLYVMGQSVKHGKRLGFAAVLGISGGCLVHALGVAIGLSSLLFASAFAFTVVKFVGACYLFYLGITALLKKQNFTFNHHFERLTEIKSWGKVFSQGFFINILNPKVALFFLAFLPQFVISPSKYAIWMQLLFLGLIFNLSGSIVNGLVAFFFGATQQWIANHPMVMKIQQKITGILLIGFGLRLAAFEKA